MIALLTNAGALPSLEMTMRFAAQRQRIIAHNIANFDTPEFVQKDASVNGFRATLDRAIAQRRQKTGGMHGDLAWRETRELKHAPGRGLVVVPGTPVGGLLAHDRNNRDLERTMQDLAETTAAFRVASDLYRAHRDVIHSAIAERV